MTLLPQLHQMPEGKACPPQTVWAIEPIAPPTRAVAYSNHGFHYGPAFEQHLWKYDMYSKYKTYGKYNSRKEYSTYSKYGMYSEYDLRRVQHVQQVWHVQRVRHVQQVQLAQRVQHIQQVWYVQRVRLVQSTAQQRTVSTTRTAKTTCAELQHVPQV